VFSGDGGSATDHFVDDGDDLAADTDLEEPVGDDGEVFIRDFTSRDS
jgi:hypothetical protein